MWSLWLRNLTLTAKSNDLNLGGIQGEVTQTPLVSNPSVPFFISNEGSTAYNDWQITSGSYRDSNPMGKQITDFIKEFPEFIIYIRKDMRFKCPYHWSEEQNSASAELIDHWCLGFGVGVKLTIAPIRISRGTKNIVTFMQGSEKENPGFTYNYRHVAHIPRNLYPKVEDYILECEWNMDTHNIGQSSQPTPRPYRIASMYVIKEVNLEWEREVSWYSCGIDAFEIKKDLFTSLIPKYFTNLPVLKLEDGWPQKSYWSG